MDSFQFILFLSPSTSGLTNPSKPDAVRARSESGSASEDAQNNPTALPVDEESSSSATNSFCVI
ncbi:hypothetical protein C8R42DRAFT_673694, partial [Lentinula raphanica]